MKAWVLHQEGDIRLEDVNNPVITEQEVLVQVKSAGLCGSDIPRIYQTGAHVYPLIPGHEFSGVAVQTGNAVDKQWQGRRVGYFSIDSMRNLSSVQQEEI